MLWTARAMRVCAAGHALEACESASRHTLSISPFICQSNSFVSPAADADAAAQVEEDVVVEEQEPEVAKAQ